MKIVLPTILNPISRRKDKSVKLSFETRELNDTEIMTLMKMEGVEMWLCLSHDENDIEIPDEKPEVDEKSLAQRQKGALYYWWKKENEANRYVGTSDMFYKEKMEKNIEAIKSKLD